MEKRMVFHNYYENGQLKTKGQFKDGKVDGLWQDYYKNGQLEYKGIFRAGEPDGIRSLIMKMVR